VEQEVMYRWCLELSDVFLFKRDELTLKLLKTEPELKETRVKKQNRIIGDKKWKEQETNPKYLF
jgi:hypothetical protein